MEITFRNISKRYGWGKTAKTALDAVSWNARSGEILGILGPNGAGKSTALKVLLGILEPDSGEVLINLGKIEISAESFRHKVGYLTEERALYKSSRVLDTIKYFGLLKGMSARAAAARAEELIEAFELTEYRKTENKKLSKGLTQRVQLATALVHSPTLLILDEPLSGLDPVATNLVRKHLAKLRDEGVTIVLCSHQMKEVESVCDNIVMLMDGRVVLSGEPDQIRRGYGDGQILVTGDAEVRTLASVAGSEDQKEGYLLRLHAHRSLHDLIAEIAEARLSVSRIEQAMVPLEEIFVEIVREKRNELQEDTANCTL